MGSLPLRCLAPLDQIEKFAAQNSMEWKQENGQRIFGPPINCNQLPTKGTEVYISNLPRNANEMDLFIIFRLAGPIYQIRLMMDFSGHNRGYSFVRYFNVMDAHKAIRLLNYTNFSSVGRHHVRVSLSYDNCFLILQNFPNRHPFEILREAMKIITRPVMRLTIVYETQTSYACLVEFVSHREAALARVDFLKGNWRFWGGLVTVDWALEEDKMKPIWQ